MGFATRVGNVADQSAQDGPAPLPWTSGFLQDTNGEYELTLQDETLCHAGFEHPSNSGRPTLSMSQTVQRSPPPMGPKSLYLNKAPAKLQ